MKPGSAWKFVSHAQPGSLSEHRFDQISYGSPT